MNDLGSAHSFLTHMHGGCACKETVKCFQCLKDEVIAEVKKKFENGTAILESGRSDGQLIPE